MTQDWRIYEMLTKKDWRPGEEADQPVGIKVVVTYGDHTIEIPLPPHATAVNVEG